ncbi:Major Facilitator Superfamily protein [Nocardioides sp. YR527]|uniref:MFS transporter n=1 Tax=Nocardioides sp. YR527 TaxID=1881028 RepID=UPI00088687D5|nr:MFS transporter [Nocardioides sp. YR527]SDK67975.1 Major Facilitator Superfamily protein [Nocardioides sp. YR527]
MSPSTLTYEPRRAAYVALLACSTLGTLSSTIISAPINVIAHAIGASPRGIVFAVSAFTLAMVVFAPISGWMCQRFGSRWVLAGSLLLMVAAQAGAAFSQGLAFLVVMRALQGIACSAVPPAIQQVLGRHWAGNRARVMAAWAAAIGVGQALGPPLGGLVADTLGWRWVFLTHASLSAVLLVLCLTVVPDVPPSDAPLHVSGMATLLVGVGALVGAVSWLGQHGEVAVAAAMAAVGVLVLVVHSRLGRTSAGPFVPPGLLTERRFVASTLAAGTVMGCLGVAIVATPLHLGRDLGLGPGHIGITMLALALAMTLAAPLSSRITERFTARRTLRGGLVLLALGLLALPLAATASGSGTVVGLTVAALVLTGAAIGVVQATSALGLMTSPAAADGVALGIHNMLRFTGLAIGYSWVAIAYPTGNLSLVYGVPVAAVALTWAMAGPGPAAPSQPVAERVFHDHR